MESVMRLIVHF